MLNKKIMRLKILLLCTFITFQSMGQVILNIDYKDKKPRTKGLYADCIICPNKASGKNMLSSVKKAYAFAIYYFELKSGMTVNVSAQAPQGTARLGMILYLQTGDKYKAVKTLCWNKKLSADNFTQYKFKVDFLKLKEKSGKYQLILFKSNQCGIINLQSLNIEEYDTSRINEKLVVQCWAQPDRRTIPFTMGVYIYNYAVKRAAKSFDKEYIPFLNHHLKRLKANGVQAVYFGGVNAKRGFPEELAVFKKNDLKVIPQIDSCYFSGKYSKWLQNKRAKNAAQFTKKYNQDTSILAWSVKEEPCPEDLPKLKDYYDLIKKYNPDIRFHLENSLYTSVKSKDALYPYIAGFTRYSFWFELSGGGYLNSPSGALMNFKNILDNLYPYYAQNNSVFTVTATQGGLTLPRAANRYCNEDIFSKYIKSISNKKTIERETVLKKRLKLLAKKSILGWKQFKEGDNTFYNMWKYYRLPKNCFKALAWTTVMEGGKMFFCWSYTPPTKQREKETFENTASLINKKEVGLFTLAGRQGWKNQQLREYAEVSKELAPYRTIIGSMRKTKASPVIIQTKNVYNKAFLTPVGKGWIIVFTNFNVGTWPFQKNNYFAKNNSQSVKIDNHGNLIGYKAYTSPLKTKFIIRYIQSPFKVYDLRNGKEIQATNGKYKISILPGSGQFVYIGNDEDMNKLMKIKLK
jgi:hypothetical protein